MPDALYRRIAGHPLYVWLICALAALGLICCPLILADPAIWLYVLDPELLALFVVLGFQYLSWEIAWLRLRISARLRRDADSDGQLAQHHD